MGLYIPSAEYPESCERCDFIRGFQNRFCPFLNIYLEQMINQDSKAIHKDCPLIEVVTPHGRLIDGFRLHKRVEDRINNGDDIKPKDYLFEIDLAPTIIEGEE